MNLKEILKEGVVIILTGIILTLVGVVIYDEFEQISKMNKVEFILDENKDGKLSSGEIKRFYDEMGINPYIKDSFYSLPEKSFEKFLNRYE
jgi:hypothetical protein